MDSFSFALNLALDSQTNVLVTGTATGTTVFGFPVDGTGFVLKLTSAGAITWLRQVASGTVQGYALAVDGADEIYVTGQLEGTSDFGGTVLNSAGPDDVFVAKYGSDGENRWALRAGGTNAGMALTEYGLSIASGPEGEVVAGSLGFLGVSGTHLAGFGSLNVTNLGGFASSFIAQLPHAPPQLNIAAAGEDILLSWPAFPPGFHLESAEALTAPAPALWMSNATVPLLLAGSNCVTVAVTNDHQFFRLRKPGY